MIFEITFMISDNNSVIEEVAGKHALHHPISNFRRLGLRAAEGE